MDNRSDKLINMVLKHESGYSMVIGDRGGETYRGITRKNFPNWNGWSIVDANKPLKNGNIIHDRRLENDVFNFYYRYFYSPLKLDDINNLLICGHLLCHSVNAGIKNGVKLLQKAINDTYSININVDGCIGKQTINYTNGSMQNELCENFIKRRKQYYVELVNKRPSQKKFLNGWLNRVDNTTKMCSKNDMLSSLLHSANGLLSNLFS